MRSPGPTVRYTGFTHETPVTGVAPGQSGFGLVALGAPLQDSNCAHGSGGSIRPCRAHGSDLGRDRHVRGPIQGPSREYPVRSRGPFPMMGEWIG